MFTTTTSSSQKTSVSPFRQLAVDKSKLLFKILLFAGGPLFRDAQSVIRNFRDCHNVIRNAIYGFIVVFFTSIFLYIAATFTDFKGLVGIIASATGGINEDNIFLKALLFYIDYLFTTHIAAAVADSILDVSFISCYGDREYALSPAKKLELAKAFSVPVNIVEEEFNKLLNQFRSAEDFTKEKMGDLIRAVVTRPSEEVKKTIDEYIVKRDQGKELLLQFKDTLVRNSRVLRLVNRTMNHIDGAIDDIAENLGLRPPEDTTFRTLQVNHFPTVGTTTAQENRLQIV